MKISGDIVQRLRGPGIADYELDCGVAEAAAKEIERLRKEIDAIREQSPKAWLITGSKMFQDAVVTTEAMADRRIEERGSRDQSRKIPLVSLE